MNVDAVAICFVVNPVSFINVAVDMNELALTMCTVIFPITLITGTVRPDLLTKTVSEATDPFTLIGRTRSESVNWSFFTRGVWIVFCVSNCLFLLINSEIAAISALGLSH